MSDAPTGQMRAHPLLSVEVGGQTDKGRVRPGNEDSFYVEDPASAQARTQGTLLVVADGMGGHAAGEVASEIAVNTVRDTFYHAHGAPTADALRHAIATANSAIYQSAEHNPNHSGMGCTIVALVVNGSDLTIGHVGDSRAYLIRAGRTHQITADHSWVAMQVAEGILTPEQAAHHPNRSLLLRALGRQPSVEIDVGAGKLQVGDVLLVCSDGLTGVVKDEEIGEYASRSAPRAAADQLIRLANQRGAPDNVTVVTAAIRGSAGTMTLADASSAATVIVPAVDAPTPRHNKVLLDAPTLRGAEVLPPDGPPPAPSHTPPAPTLPYAAAPTTPHAPPPPTTPHGVSLTEATVPMQVLTPTAQPAPSSRPKPAALSPLGGTAAPGLGYGQGPGSGRRTWMGPLLTTLFGCLVVGALAFFVAQRAGWLDSTTARTGEATAVPATATAYAAPTQSQAPTPAPTTEPARPAVTPILPPTNPVSVATSAPTSAPTSATPALGTGGLPNLPGVSGAVDAVATRVGGGAVTGLLTPGPAASSTPTAAPMPNPSGAGSTQPGPAGSVTPSSSSISSEPAPDATPTAEPTPSPPPTEEQIVEPTATARVITLPNGRPVEVPPAFRGQPTPKPQQQPQAPRGR